MKCANPHCQAESLYLRSGTLHSIDYVEEGNNAVKRRIIWLCDSCAQLFAVEPWRLPGEQLQQRPKPVLPHSTSESRRMARRRVSLSQR
jgi:hypothetical protein